VGSRDPVYVGERNHATNFWMTSNIIFDTYSLSHGAIDTMAGKATAVKNGEELKLAVAELGKNLGLEAKTEVKVGRRIWGAKRYIDVVLTHPATRIRLGIEAKYQGMSGSAEEKIPSTLKDIEAWPIRGIVVVDGEGFSDNMRGFLVSTGKVVDFEDLEDWVRLYFGL
jgi:hypothetical protein